MDKIQIYAIVCAGLELIAFGYCVADTENFEKAIAKGINILLILPFFGRIFGWW
ncbi:MAG: hypothetical protein PHF86_10590 [Candidatus Nanoarchaeia archaeon]|jgi:hypothetical protein|nr:hypothetical protein [Candidatus Nanoarchaeia archaeon]